ncbi:hypothetical protein [Alicyclobacillus sp. SO9]|uniref:hypothetical protein n=1 Tax=Alicyclobacillus sp. SO9 TaxID=2665646 RepID=UPI0018E81FE5|nr:hypothetical protein [Alicyclobacillus sp. SO9]QQE80599.1 hypothetical protein GI364_09415 [Alicyclobacillus sp. SO9]
MNVYQAVFGDGAKQEEFVSRNYQTAAKLAILDGIHMAEAINETEYENQIDWDKQPPLTGSRRDLRIMIGYAEGTEHKFYIDIRTMKAPMFMQHKDPGIPKHLSDHEMKLVDMYAQLIETGRYGNAEIVE